MTWLRFFAFFFLLFSFFRTAACRRTPAPFAISNKPVSVNDVPLTNQPLAPTKPLEEMTWAVMDNKTAMEGSVFKLKDFEGKAVILDFWATYCAPCIEGIPHLRALQKKYGKENLE